MAGKVDTGRTISLEATVDAPPQAVFALWTTEEGVKRFFAPKAVIEPRLGGRYEIVFVPQADPEGDPTGPRARASCASSRAARSPSSGSRSCRAT